MLRWLQTVLAPLLLVLLIIGALTVRFQPSARAVVADFMYPFLYEKQVISRKLLEGPLFSHPKTELINTIHALHEQVEKQRLQLALRDNQIQENAALRRLLGMRAHQVWNSVVARIISRDPATGFRRIRIDRGESDGILVGQLVLRNQAVLGRIARVARHSALVLLLSDPDCRLSVALQNGKQEESGILHGLKSESWRLAPRCAVDYLPRDGTYRVGQKIVTSRYSRCAPPGLPVGVLTEAPDGGDSIKIIDQLYKRAYVRITAFEKDSPFVMVLIGANSPVATGNNQVQTVNAPLPEAPPRPNTGKKAE